MTSPLVALQMIRDFNHEPERDDLPPLALAMHNASCLGAMRDIAREALAAMNTDDRALADLTALQEWMREPDNAKTFGTKQILEWLNRRPTHVVSKVLATLDRLEAFHAKPVVGEEWVLVPRKAGFWQINAAMTALDKEAGPKGGVVISNSVMEMFYDAMIAACPPAAMLDVAPIPGEE